VLLEEVDEPVIADRVWRRHDQAREDYPDRSITVANATEFENGIGDYYAYHYELCVAPGARMAPAEAIGRAKQIIENDRRRQGQTLLNAFTDAKDGRNGAMRALRDLIGNALKEESTEHYIEDVFCRHVDMDSWSQRVEVMKEFLAQYGRMLPPSHRNQPAERFASGYKTLIRAYVDALRETAAAFRRI
jgi:hypothetical protein